MLTLGRESGQYIVIGEDIVVQVVEVGGQLRLAIDAPRSLAIVRGENWEKTRPAPQCIQALRSKTAPPKGHGFNRASGRAVEI